MAKKAWKVDVEKGLLTRVNYGDGVVDLTLDVEALFANYAEMEKVQKMTILNGIKQKLADTIAVSKDAALTAHEKREKQETLWKRMTEDREWNLPSDGATSPYEKMAKKFHTDEGWEPERIAEFLSQPLAKVNEWIEN